MTPLNVVFFGSFDLVVWAAMGGTVVWIGWLFTFLCPQVAPQVLRLGALGFLGWLGFFAPCSQQPWVKPEYLEQWTSQSRMGPVLILLGLGGLIFGVVQHMRTAPSPKRRTKIIVAYLLPLLALPYVMMPPWAPDEALYHLSLPVHRFLSGRLQAPPGHGNGGFFALGDTWSSLGLWMGSVTAARGGQVWALMFAGRALLALLPQHLAFRLLTAQGLMVFSPVVFWQLGCAYVDVTAACLTVVAVIALAQGLSGLSEPNRRQTLLVATWLMGCACATKANHLVLLPAWLLILLAAHRRTALSVRPWQDGLALAGVALAPVLPFVCRNILQYHAPLFPFGTMLWPGGEALAPSQVAALAAFMQVHGPSQGGVPLRGLAAWVALPWALISQSDFASPRFDGVVGVLPVVWLAITSWRCVRRTAAWPGCDLRLVYGFLQGTAVLGCLVFVSTSWQARFLITPLHAMAVTVALGWPVVPRRAGWRAFYSLAGCAVVVGYMWAATGLVGHLPPWRFCLLGKNLEQRIALRQAMLPASRLCDGTTLGANSRTLLVWSQRLSLWCTGDIRSDSYDESASLIAALAAQGGAGRYLRTQGITHLLVQRELWADSCDAAQWLAWQTFAAQQLYLLKQSGPYALYALHPGGSLRP